MFADKLGKAIFATKQNMEALDSEMKSAIKRRAEATGNQARAREDMEFLSKQKAAMTGTNLMQQILSGRKDVQQLFDHTAARVP